MNLLAQTGFGIMSIRHHKFLKLLVAALLVFSLAGCKDDAASTQEGYLEDCKVYSDELRWGKAIEACAKVDSDEGKHLLAQAYMGRAGINLFGFMASVGTADNPMNQILKIVPKKAADSRDYYTALSIIMSDIQIKDDTMYIEALVLSSMLVYKQLVDLFNLKVSGTGISTCADVSLTRCSFEFSILKTEGYTTGLAFTGLGTTFYDNLCQIPTKTGSAATSSNKVYSLTNYLNDYALDWDIDYDMTIYSCDIKAKSPLAYNRIAGKKLAGNQLLGDALTQLKIAEALDSGYNFSQSVSDLRDDIALCNSGYNDPPVANDEILSDCEILGYLTNQ